MTQIFISHSHDDVDCAEQIRLELEASGYTVWKDAQSIAPGSASYVRAIENGLRGSAAVVVLWSKNAAESEWVERELLFAEQLQIPRFPILIDATPPGILLVAAQYVHSRFPCEQAVTQLLPHLPPLGEDDALYQVLQQLSHPYIRERRKGIEQAAALLAQGKYTEKLLAALEDLARKDTSPNLQEEARKVLAAQRKPDSPVPNNQSRHIIQVRCPNGHISYFDKRRICPASSTFKRSSVVRGGTALDEIYLKCTTCGEEMVVPVDCEGYK